MIKEAFAVKGVSADLSRVNSGPLGGDAEIAALVAKKRIDPAVFITSTLWDEEDYVPTDPRYVKFVRDWYRPASRSPIAR